MLHPYLPEGMRNPETFEWMLSNPEYRAQLEGMLQQQVDGGVGLVGSAWLAGRCRASPRPTLTRTRMPPVPPPTSVLCRPPRPTAPRCRR